ncbi:MAG: hypothetical protein FJ218_08905 [Ignavibacteria bacterium]|nr:hypothetical protein [Ignavibacteria bacterium]
MQIPFCVALEVQYFRPESFLLHTIMTDDILREIVTEIKSLRYETFDEIKALRQESIATNKRLDESDKRLDILREDMKVLIIGMNDTCETVYGMRKMMPNVIWQNDLNAIDTD